VLPEPPTKNSSVPKELLEFEPIVAPKAKIVVAA
jgi:hypothetical protein